MENSLFQVNELMTKQQNASIIRELSVIFESLSMTHQSFESTCLRGILWPNYLMFPSNVELIFFIASMSPN